MVMGQIQQRIPLLGAVAICAAHFGSFEIFSRPLVTDIRYYVYFSWRVAEGAVPHVDFFGNKTQLAAMLGGLLFPLAEFYWMSILPRVVASTTPMERRASRASRWTAACMSSPFFG